MGHHFATVVHVAMAPAAALAWSALLLLASPVAALRLAVTGASGYLGREICHQAAAQGHRVRAVE